MVGMVPGCPYSRDGSKYILGGMGVVVVWIESASVARWTVVVDAHVGSAFWSDEGIYDCLSIGVFSHSSCLRLVGVVD